MAWYERASHTEGHTNTFFAAFCPLTHSLCSLRAFGKEFFAPALFHIGGISELGSGLSFCLYIDIGCMGSACENDFEWRHPWAIGDV
jgi:hypothetical protein